MALSATFTANFASFYDAVDKADAKLKDFGSGADKVGTRLNALSNQFSGVKVVQEATLMAKAVEEIGGVSKLTEKEMARLGATTNEAVAKMKALGMDVPKNLQKIADETKGANKASVDWMGTLNKMAGAVGIAFSIGAVTNFIGSVFDAAGAIKDQSTAIGFSAEGFQRLKYAVEQGGGSMAGFTSAASKLNDNLAGGSDSTVAALQKAGLSFQAIRNMKPEDAFLAVSEAVGQIEDPMVRAAVAQDLFGKGAIELLPGMIEGYRQVADGATVMSQETIDRLEAAGDAWERLGNQVVIITGEIIGRAMKDLEEDMQFQAEFWGSIAALVQGGIGAYRGYNAALAQSKAATEDARVAEFWYGEAQGKRALAMAGAGGLTFSTQAQTEADKKAATAAEQHAKAQEKLAKEIAEHNQVWRNRLILLEAMEAWNRRVAQAEDQQRLAYFRTLPVIQGVTAAEQERMRANALALAQRGDQILSFDEYTAAQNRNQTAIEYNWRSTQTATEKNHDFTASLSAIAGAFAQLGQISGGSLGGIAGGIGSAIGALNVAVTSAKDIGKGLGSTITGITGVVGAMAAVANIVTQIGKASWELKVLRNDFIRASGGPRALAEAAEKAGVSLEGLYSKHATDVERAMKRITAALDAEKLREAFVTAAGGAAALTRAAETAGVEVDELFAARDPEAAAAAIKDIEDALKFQEDAMALLLETTERYGFTLEELGPALQRQKLDEQAQQLYQDWQVLNSAGIDTVAITDRMGESVSKYVQDAMKMGTEIPAAMRPMLEAFARSGTLLDENGEAITDLDEDGLKFSMTMSEGFKGVIDEVKKLTEAISRGLGLAIEEVPDIEVERTVTTHYRVADDPNYRLARPELGPAGGYVHLQQGTHGFRNFGAGTPAMLHGWEAVVPRDEASRAFATVRGAGGSASPAAVGEMRIVLQQDGRNTAEWLLPFIPGAARRLGLAGVY